MTTTTWSRLNVVLAILAMIAVATLVVLRTQGSEALPGSTPTERVEETEREVRAAATAEVTAFLEVDHQSVDEQAEAVLAGATGDFKKQYAEQLDQLRESAEQQQSVAEAEILEVGISDLTETRSSVFVAVNTEVTSKDTKGKPRTVPWRIQMTLVHEDGRWLTSDLQFVG